MRPCVCHEHQQECDCEDGDGVRNVLRPRTDFDTFYTPSVGGRIKIDFNKASVLFYVASALFIGSLVMIAVTSRSFWVVPALVAGLIIWVTTRE